MIIIRMFMMRCQSRNDIKTIITGSENKAKETHKDTCNKFVDSIQRQCFYAEIIFTVSG